MNKLRLSFYTNIPTPYQADFFDALSRQFDLTVIYYAPSERGRQWTVGSASKAYRVIRLQDSWVARWLQRWVADYHFSWSIFGIVHRDGADYAIVSGAYWIPNTLIILLMNQWRGRKTAFFGERLSRPSTGRRSMVKRILLRPLRHTCVRLFAVGQEAARTYDAAGVAISQTIVPYTIDVARFANSDGVKRGTLVLLSAGALIHRKGMDTLIRAFRQLDQRNYGHVRLRIVGDGPERSALQRMAGDDLRIELLGFQDADALPDCFGEADIFVFASRYDGWGVVINEAVAAGLPIVSSCTVGAARAWVRDGVNGFVCPADDVNAFCKAMRRLIDDPALRQQQADYNRAFRAQTSSAHYAEVMRQAILTDLRA